MILISVHLNLRYLPGCPTMILYDFAVLNSLEIYMYQDGK